MGRTFWSPCCWNCPQEVPHAEDSRGHCGGGAVRQEHPLPGGGHGDPGNRGLILLTDSDGAGFLIRNYLKGALPQDQVKHAYIPDRYGKERRKRRPGKEGKLGVEGMPPAVLEAALRQAGATVLGEDSAPPQAPPLTKADLYACGLSGGEGSREKRQKLLRKLDLPSHLSPNAMLPILSALYDRNALLEEMRNL